MLGMLSSKLRVKISFFARLEKFVMIVLKILIGAYARIAAYLHRDGAIAGRLQRLWPIRK